MSTDPKHLGLINALLASRNGTPTSARPLTLSSLLHSSLGVPEPETPEPATPARSLDLMGELRRQVAGLADKFRDKPAARPASKPAPPPAAVSGTGIEAGRTWRYAVVVEPPAWRDITLTYRTQREGAGIGVLTDFVHAEGKMNFHLGTFAAGHPSHANTRFPGFFMHASYLPPSLKEGQRLASGWPWQPVREGRTPDEGSTRIVAELVELR